MEYVGAISVPSAQIHVSDFCNLNCKHCYSSSSPDGLNTLKLEEIIRFLDLIEEEEYQYVSFSGGEPLLFKEIYSALEECCDRGFQNN